MYTCVCRYEDGDAEHLQWAELKHILLSLPARDDVSPPVVSKPNYTAAKTGKPSDPACGKSALTASTGAGDICCDFTTGAAVADTAKKQKISPAGADSAKKQKVSPANADSTRKQKVSPAGADPASKQQLSPADAPHEVSPEGILTHTVTSAALHTEIPKALRVYCRQDLRASGEDYHQDHTPTQQASEVSEGLVG